MGYECSAEIMFREEHKIGLKLSSPNSSVLIGRKGKTLDALQLLANNRGSLLLEPMNPFERRLIHTTLNEIGDVETKSEGEGLYKQVRVFYKGVR